MPSLTLSVAGYVHEERLGTLDGKNRLHRGLEREERAVEARHLSQCAVHADTRQVAGPAAHDTELVKKRLKFLPQIVENDDAPLSQEAAERRCDVLMEAVHHPLFPSSDSAW